jgi:membrane protein YdbS with pleckstrin-like domain
MTDGRRTRTRDAFAVEADWQPIAPEARLVWTLSWGALAAPVLLLFALVLALGFGRVGIAVGLALAAATLGLLRLLAGRRYRAWSYALRDEELVLRRGRLVRRLTIVPIGRLQLVDLRQGPLDRRLGVASLHLHTAAAASDARIPMLEVGVADALRDELIARGAGRHAGA